MSDFDVVAFGPHPLRATRWWEERWGPARVLAACADERRVSAARRNGIPTLGDAAAAAVDPGGVPYALLFNPPDDEAEATFAAARRAARDAVVLVYPDAPAPAVVAALERVGAARYACAPLGDGGSLAVVPVEPSAGDGWLDLFTRVASRPREVSADQLMTPEREISLGDLLRARQAPGDRADVSVAAAHPGAAVRLEAPVTLAGEVEDPSRLEPGYVAEPVAVAELRQAAVVMPEGGVLTGRGELVLESGSGDSFAAELARAHPDLPRRLRRPPRDREAEPVALLTNARRPHYYSWWVDCLPRIWLYDEHTEHAGCPLVAPAELAPFELESLELLGAAGRLRPQAEPVRAYPTLLLSPGLAWRDVPSPMLRPFAGWVRGTLGITEGATGARLYVKRAGARQRRVVDEAGVGAALEPLGFEAVELDGMSVREQVERFAAAEAIVGAHGAGLTNMLFSPAGTTVVELFSPGGFHDSRYRRMARICGHAYHALVGTSPPDGADAQDVVVDPAQLAAMLERALERATSPLAPG